MRSAIIVNRHHSPTRSARRELDGVLLLDKPLGLSSNDALMRAKRLLGAKKAGHTGTLDPLASGLLPLCFGEATKFSQDLLEAPKTYEATLALGATTTTGDAEGEVLRVRPVTISADDFAAVLSRFLGEIEQVPPMYSALKRDGRSLYEYARAGVTVEREARRITIFALEMIDCALPGTASARIRVRCSKGTYVRTLAEDIGEALGCGAHLGALRRTAVGDLALEGALTLEALDGIAEPQRPACLHPVDFLLRSFDAVRLDEDMARRFVQGQKLRIVARAPGAAPEDDAAATIAHASGAPGERVRVYEAGGRLLGTAMRRDGVIAPQRVIATAPPTQP
jgi:tRNA pseudouridine55 synthase